MIAKFAALAALVAGATAQQACSLTAERHPSLSWQRCTASGCSNVAGSITLDANWRWTHTVQGYTNCYTGNEWNKTICTNGQTCASQCCVDGADYSGTYGITTSGSQLNIKFVTKGEHGTNVGGRTYLMENENRYQTFNLLNNEFTFDVDVSNVPCGVNGALYFVSMDADGGLARDSGNKAGAKYGTGYCDAQCPRDLKFINGIANVEGWTGSDSDGNAGLGRYGSCCSEMDIWEANSISTAYTPHPCYELGQHRCEGDSCGGTYSNDRYGGTCDADGCDFSAYRQGDKTFYGPGMKLDTNKKMTVVTQFLTNTAGDLSEIKRFYVQDGVIVANAESLVPGVPGNSITTEFCSAQKQVFGDIDDFALKGGLAQQGYDLTKAVLVMSIWDDHYANMLWLDSTYPIDKAGQPGAERGTCPTDSGVPAEVEAQFPNSSVSFSNIRFGPINSTVPGLANFNPGNPGTPSNPGTPVSSVRPSSTIRTTTAPSPTAVAQKWGQCGGRNWNGPTACVSGSTCTVLNEWYSQCI